MATARPTGPAKLAPRDPALEAWKRAAAERIHAANQKKLFEGRPHHLLQAVIVVEATVDRSGNVVRSRVMRSPKIKTLDDMALASLKAASPLPAPPPSLLVRGNLVYSETFLVNNDEPLSGPYAGIAAGLNRRERFECCGSGLSCQPARGTERYWLLSPMADVRPASAQTT